MIAAALGVAIDWSQLGHFPIVATARSEGPSSSPGLDYLVYLPDGYHRSFGRWPLILALHGSGAVGGDIARLRAEGLPRRIEGDGMIPFIVIAPQSPRQGWNAQALDAMLDEVLRRYRVDADRVYLTGSSMGGYGAWALAAAYPKRFAAIAPICGGGDPAWADRLRDVPAWAFHGAEDTVVPPEESRKMVQALKLAAGDVRLTIYSGVGHDAATPTYADHGLYEWFLAHNRRAGDVRAKAAITPSSALWKRTLELDPPFVMVTGWNEWVAGRGGEPGGPVVFVDQFDQESSRDIEPVKGGHADNYYQIMDFYVGGDVAPEGRFAFR